VLSREVNLTQIKRAILENRLNDNPLFFPGMPNGALGTCMTGVAAMGPGFTGKGVVGRARP